MTRLALVAVGVAMGLATAGCAGSASGVAAPATRSTDPATRPTDPATRSTGPAAAPPGPDVSQPPLPLPDTPASTTPSLCPVADLTAAWRGEAQDCLEPEVLSHLFFPERSFTTDLADTYTQDVVFIQLRLRDLGQSVSVDGRYGPQTAQAVRGYQRSHGLVVDGVVGLATWTSLFHLGRG